MKRSDVIKVALPGDLGKPRPAVIVQSDLFYETGSIAILPITSLIADISVFRVLVAPSAENGLRVPSHVMIDKITNLRREKVGGVIGRFGDDTMIAINQQLALFLGIG